MNVVNLFFWVIAVLGEGIARHAWDLYVISMVIVVWWGIDRATWAFNHELVDPGRRAAGPVAMVLVTGLTASIINGAPVSVLFPVIVALMCAHELWGRARVAVSLVVVTITLVAALFTIWDTPSFQPARVWLAHVIQPATAQPGTEMGTP